MTKSVKESKIKFAERNFTGTISGVIVMESNPLQQLDTIDCAVSVHMLTGNIDNDLCSMSVCVH